MKRQMSLLEEMAMAAGVERLVRRRRRKTLFGMDSRWIVLMLIVCGSAITTAVGLYRGNRSKERQHSSEHSKLAA